MENREAIEILRDMGGCCSSDNEYIACDMAISALEKQEGKKPKLVSKHFTWEECPNCGSIFFSSYCGECGQRIDWSDEHDTD